MKTPTTAMIILALVAPLLVGAVASRKPAAERDISPTRDATPSNTQPEQVASAPDLQAPVREYASATTELATPASTASPSTYVVDWYSINGGGVIDAASTNYRVGASVGQSVAGGAASANYQMGIGFWYGASGGGGPCACDCHGDPGGDCDGVRTVLDVVQVVNVAFRNAAPILDPNANCPYQTTDVNCTNSTDVVDVVKMVNVAFRNADEASEFCSPCQ